MHRSVVLLVMADCPELEGLAEALRGAGHRVQRAGDAPAALALVKAVLFTAVVIDLALPGLDGAALLGQVRRTTLEARKPMPVVALSPHAWPGRALFDDDHQYQLPRPFAAQDVVRAVARALALGMTR